MGAQQSCLEQAQNLSLDPFCLGDPPTSPSVCPILTMLAVSSDTFISDSRGELQGSPPPPSGVRFLNLLLGGPAPMPCVGATGICVLEFPEAGDSLACQPMAGSGGRSPHLPSPLLSFLLLLSVTSSLS